MEEWADSPMAAVIEISKIAMSRSMKWEVSLDIVSHVGTQYIDRVKIMNASASTIMEWSRFNCY